MKEIIRQLLGAWATQGVINIIFGPPLLFTGDPVFYFTFLVITVVGATSVFVKWTLEKEERKS